MLKALELYGADVTRCGLLLAAEDMDDPDWRAEALRDVKSKLEAFNELADGIMNLKETAPAGHLDRWLLSSLQTKIKRVEQAISVMKNRTALENALFEVWNDFRWYLRRCETPNAKVLKEALGIWVRLMAPFTPHVCEGIWQKMSGGGFVVEASWPSYDPGAVDLKAEDGEKVVRDTMDDTSNLLKAMKFKPRRICYYTASEWKWDAYLKALEKAEAGALERGELIKELVSEPSLKAMAQEVASFVGKTADQISRMPTDIRRMRLQLGKIEEVEVLKGARKIYSKQFDAEIEVFAEEDPRRYDPKKRSGLAQPYRPAIFVE